jgi:Tol biopolymer transport system component/DNA-binding winged helix-turn-helix (wHTH) protein
MTDTQPQSRLVRFGVFEVDLRTGELRKAGVKLKFSGQPFQVLAILLERPGDVITREELQKRLWPDTFVDTERNLNTAINKIREVLGDSAESPSYVETLPRRGYRFIAPINGGVLSSDPLVEKVPPAASKGWGKPRYYGLAILGALVITIGVVSLWKTVSRTQGTPRVLRFTKLTNDGQAKVGPMATDGSRIYFKEVVPGPRNLILQVAVKGGEAIPLPVPLKQPSVLDMSKDGTELLLANREETEGKGGSEYLLANDLSREDGSVWLQPVAGGSPRRVGTILSIDAAFGLDGTSIIYSNNNAVYSVSRDGSSSRKLFTVAATPFGFRFSRDARFFRFTQWNPVGDVMTMMESTPDGTGLHQMFEGCCGEWTPDGKFFILQNRQEGRLDLWALPEEKRFWRGKRDDKPTQLTAGPLDFQYPLPSKDGKEIFAIGTLRRAEVVRYDAHSSQFVPFLSGISAEGLAFSRDGQWTTYTLYPEGTLWRSRVDGSERTQLTFPPLRAFYPRWSPDGKQIAFSGFVPGATFNVYLLSSEGGTPQRIHPIVQMQTDVSWSPDGNSLLYGSLPGYDAPIYSIDLKTQRVSPLPGSDGLNSPRWSPDGKHIAALSMAHHILMLFDLTTQKWTEAFGSSAVGWENWSRDGRYIYFVEYHNPVQDFDDRVVRFRLKDHKVENIVEVQNVGRRTTGTLAAWVGLAPDDSPLFARDISSQEIYALEMSWP